MSDDELRFFTPHEFRTVQALSDWIIPPDEASRGGGAAGTAEFLDYIATSHSQLKLYYCGAARGDLQGSLRGGLSWLDAEMQRRHGACFLECSIEQQREILDLIAYRRNNSVELEPGIRFFALLRIGTVAAFYTSREGIRDLGYQGNAPVAEYHGCGRNVVQELLDRSPLH